MSLGRRVSAWAARERTHRAAPSTGEDARGLRAAHLVLPSRAEPLSFSLCLPRTTRLQPIDAGRWSLEQATGDAGAESGGIWNEGWRARESVCCVGDVTTSWGARLKLQWW